MRIQYQKLRNMTHTTCMYLSVFIAFEGANFYILSAITAAGDVPCGGPKLLPVQHTYCILYFTFGPLRSEGILCEFNRSRWLSGRASASGSGGRGFEPRPRHTKGVKNGTSGYLAWCSAL